MKQGEIPVAACKEIMEGRWRVIMKGRRLTLDGFG